MRYEHGYRIGSFCREYTELRASDFSDEAWDILGNMNWCEILEYANATTNIVIKYVFRDAFGTKEFKNVKQLNAYIEKLRR